MHIGDLVFLIDTHCFERAEEVVESPGNDDDVIDVEPEGQNHSSQTHT